MQEIQETIREELDDFEDEYNIDIIAARDYGSHSEGLEGPKSDYDVMFLFVEDYPDYVFGDETETITRQSQQADVEYHGWNIRKFTSNIQGNGPNAIDFLHSDLVYYEHPDLEEQFETIEEHVSENFKPVALIEHYRSMAASNYRKYLQRSLYDGEGNRRKIVGENEDYWEIIDGNENFCQISKDLPEWSEGNRKTTVKRNLIVFHTLMKARYVEEYHELPPREYDDLLEACACDGLITENEWKMGLDLVEQKRSGNGYLYYGNRIEDYAESELDRDIDHQEHVVRGVDRDVLFSFTVDVCNVLDQG